MIDRRFIRDAAMLQIGTVAGVLIQAISGVLVARFLAPELFGQYAIAFSVASIVTIFLGAGVQDAVAPQAARAWASGDRRSLSEALGFWAKFTTANIIATLVVIVVLPVITVPLYHSRVLGGYAAVIIIASLISTTVFTLTQLMLQIAGRIRSLSALTLADVGVRYGVVIGLVVGGFGIWGAVSGHLIGAVVLLGVSLVVYGRLVRSHPEIPGIRDLMGLARRASWRPLLAPTLWVMLDRNLGMLYGALPIALVGIFAAPTEVAYFKLAFGYLMLAMTALGPVSTLLNVHFPTVQVTDHHQLRRTFIRVTLWSTLMTSAITAVVVLISPWVFHLLYGPLYGPAIPYIYGLGIFGALFGLGVGLGPMWRAVNRVHVSIIINCVVLGVGIPLGIGMMARWHLWGAVAMVTLWYTVSHVVSFAYLMSVLKKGEEEMSRFQYAWVPRDARRVLDVGCSWGYDTARLAMRDIEVYGVDANERSIEKARRLHPGMSFQVAVAERLPFANAYFDTVIMSEVLEHVQDEVVALSEAYRVLRPGGTLILSTPHRGLFGFLDPANQKYRFRAHDAGFHRHYSVAQLEGFLKKSQWGSAYRIIRTRYAGLFFGPFMGIVRGGLKRIVGERLARRVVVPLASLAQWDGTISFGRLSYQVALLIEKR